MLSPGEQYERLDALPSPLSPTLLCMSCRSNVTKILAGIETAKLQVSLYFFTTADWLKSYDTNFIINSLSLLAASGNQDSC